MDIVNPYILTFTGRRVHIFNIHPDEISIIDIAHHLSRECRYAGATFRFYSVAEHSLNMVHNAESPLAKKYALLHDASEYILKDIPSPLKHTPLMKNYILLEKYVQDKIYRKYGLDPAQVPAEIKQLDEKLIEWETAELIEGLDPNIEDLSGFIRPLIIGPGALYRFFIKTFVELFPNHSHEVEQCSQTSEKHQQNA
jgi:uncharacterized protein